MSSRVTLKSKVRRLTNEELNALREDIKLSSKIMRAELLRRKQRH